MIRRDLERAEAYRLRALDVHARARGLASPEALLELNALAAIYLEKGDQARADRLVNHILTIGGTTPRPEHRFLAETLDSLAQRAFGEFRLDLAERLATRAVQLLEALEGPGARETIQAVYMLANVQRATTDLEHAESNYRRAVQGFEAIGRHDEAVTASIDLGKIYRERGAYPVGKLVFDNAIARLRERPTPDRSLLASALGNLAELHYDAGEHELADATYAEALAALDGAKDDVERPWLLHGRAILNYHLGRHAVARDLYEEARRLWTERKGDDHPFVATATANLALAQWAVGDVDGALAAFRGAARRRDQDLRRTLAVGSERKRLAYARATLDDLHKILSFHFATTPPRADVGRFAAECTLQRKGLVLDAIAHTFAQVRHLTDPADQALIDRLQTVRAEIAGLIAPSPLGPPPAPGRERLDGLREEEERLEAALSHRGALADPDLAPVTLESVQRALPDDTALVEIVQFRSFNPPRAGTDDVWRPDRYAALVLRASGEPHWIDLGPAAAIDEVGERLRRLLRNRASAAADGERAAADLHAILVAPLEPAIAGARRLVVSPDGKLTMVPFGILGDARGQRLASRHTVSYAAAGREIQSPSATAPGTRNVVVIAAPDYEAEAPNAPAASGVDRFAERGAFAPLAGARAEGEEIEALLEDVTVLAGAAATVEAVTAVRRPAVLHVATHGFFSPIDEPEVRRSVELLPLGGGLVEQRSRVPVANPMFFSGIALAGANRRTAGASTGVLTAQQIAGLDLRGTQLVVLSACETGLGTVERGSEFTGMRRALSIAGAATQITSLWRVDDEATRALMRHFYAGLVDGLGRAEALARAQERVASDRDHPHWQHPFYWAAFVVSGAWTPMGDALSRRRVNPSAGKPS
jgi:CHAT domain-containing protein